MVTAIAGGVGAAKLLVGLCEVAGRGAVTAVVNTGDDCELHGLHISPDLDTVTYWLAGLNNAELGWGIQGESWRAMDELEALGGDAWFRLGDRDLATHLLRTGELARGSTLTEVAAKIAKARNLPANILPMSNDAVLTGLVAELAGEPTTLAFQEYFVRHQHQPRVLGLEFRGAAQASPAPGVLEAIGGADRLVICPSNPLLSIGPVLALPAIEQAVRSRRDDVVAVSPIVGGKALKGPAAEVMESLGYEPTALGVARLLAPFAATLVVDEVDAVLVQAIEDEGLRCVVTDTVMVDAAASRHLAEVVLGA